MSEWEPPLDRGAALADDLLLEVAEPVMVDLVAHAREEAPNECCGVLLGTAARIEYSVRARNQLRSRTRYLIEPEDQFRAMRMARETGLDVVGFYHSHPASTPVPSNTDRREAAYPGYAYLIVFPGGREAAAEVRAFKLREDGNFQSIALVPFR